LLACALLAACGGGGGGGGSSSGGGGSFTPPTPTPAATATPAGGATPLPASQSACTFNNVAPQSVVAVASSSTVRRMVRVPAETGPRYVPGVLEVMHASGEPLSIVRVAPGTEASETASLRAKPGVTGVVQAQYRHLETAGVYAPNDQYWSHAGTGSPPFYQTDAQGGQWDMHLMCVARAWGYSQSSGNTFGVTPGVLAGNVKIAIIDTGVDTTHPDLAGKIVYAATYVNGFQGNTVHDDNGHGTNVAGIAAAATNNGYGFAGAAFNAQIMAYRVFPDPSPGCTGTACETSASTADIDLAINDAVAHGANVINLSLGGSPTGTCTSDPGEAPEQSVITAAINAGVVVVAASGNEAATKLDCPGGDTGVIAVGASSLTDTGIGTAVTGEHIASYSNYDAGRASTWGVSAPGGDPSGSSDGDFYHWIENIWTSTETDTSGGNACGTDTFGEAGNCRILIAGTSQATPHVAGIVAMMLGAHPGLAPATVGQYLCSTALNIGDTKQGCGRVDAYRAVARALGDASVQ